MEMGNLARHRTTQVPTDAVYNDITRLGLERNVVELETYGFTVLRPEQIEPSDFAARIREQILRLAEKRLGHRLDPRAASLIGSAGKHFGEGEELRMWCCLDEGEIFEQAVVHPKPLALVTYLLGESCQLSAVDAGVKGPGKQPLGLHADNAFAPPPMSEYALVCNATWILSDYSRENGSLCVVPGSHKLCRQPTPTEVADDAIKQAIEAPAGSVVIWHGNLWHGAFARTAPGLRINLITYYCRMHIRPQEKVAESVTESMLVRNPRRFARLVGREHWYPWGKEGPNWERVAMQPGMAQGAEMGENRAPRAVTMSVGVNRFG